MVGIVIVLGLTLYMDRFLIQKTRPKFYSVAGEILVITQ